MDPQAFPNRPSSCEAEADCGILKYWGKARPGADAGALYPPLPYHSLDVAAVAASWWDTCPALRGRFLAAFEFELDRGKQLRAWILFFVALHDIGKFDLRFQLKAPEAT